MISNKKQVTKKKLRDIIVVSVGSAVSVMIWAVWFMSSLVTAIFMGIVFYRMGFQLDPWFLPSAFLCSGIGLFMSTLWYVEAIEYWNGKEKEFKKKYEKS